MAGCTGSGGLTTDCPRTGGIWLTFTGSVPIFVFRFHHSVCFARPQCFAFRFVVQSFGPSGARVIVGGAPCVNVTHDPMYDSRSSLNQIPAMSLSVLMLRCWFSDNRSTPHLKLKCRLPVGHGQNLVAILFQDGGETTTEVRNWHSLDSTGLRADACPSFVRCASERGHFVRAVPARFLRQWRHLPALPRRTILVSASPVLLVSCFILFRGLTAAMCVIRSNLDQADCRPCRCASGISALASLAGCLDGALNWTICFGLQRRFLRGELWHVSVRAVSGRQVLHWRHQLLPLLVNKHCTTPCASARRFHVALCRECMCPFTRHPF